MQRLSMCLMVLFLILVGCGSDDVVEDNSGPDNEETESTIDEEGQETTEEVAASESEEDTKDETETLEEETLEEGDLDTSIPYDEDDDVSMQIAKLSDELANTYTNRKIERRIFLMHSALIEKLGGEEEVAKALEIEFEEDYLRAHPMGFKLIDDPDQDVIRVSQHMEYVPLGYFDYEGERIKSNAFAHEYINTYAKEDGMWKLYDTELIEYELLQENR
ncbi:hypothetical protein [Evansella cellulosilytica]|uniref:Lipoprotein n=1 Tax=Evansella cellulosilytica (strain ATCC 21833 / DSM 2522 / FERM P-1141 / JCM 9156 / N-4) TaxID=649639 RepID=E6TRF7_EVAC2|nr:hypothetical protein [Evansella cellulosilytica]ADU31787.1 hypothetical protein Bcell_3546 [Evansella cellulosilytica DSM 2522]